MPNTTIAISWTYMVGYYYKQSEAISVKWSSVMTVSLLQVVQWQW